MNQKHRDMEDGRWYNLSPPSNIGGRSFSRVCCEFQHPEQLNEYVVKGIPDDGGKEESFVLKFTGRGVRVTPAEPPTERLTLLQ